MTGEHFSDRPEAPALVIGASGVDIVGRLRGELVAWTSAPAQIRFSWGGVARNVAENLARLGQPTYLITALGEDETGDRLYAATEAAGVHIHAARSIEHPTGAYLAAVNHSGALQVAMDDMRAISALTPEFIRRQEDLFQEASVLFVDANLPKDTLRTVMSMARKAKLPVCADPTSTGLASRLKPYLPRLKLITPNRFEAEVFCQGCAQINNRRLALEAAKSLVSQGVEIAVITMAEIGLCYATSETNGFIQAVRTEVVDPTGAGDALSAALIFALLNDIPIDDAVRLGVSAASLTLGFRGAVVPDLTLQKLYDQLII